ncbi:MAG: GIY-YIG nuclease family protein, partial [Terracidiphilus sp.]
ETAPLTLVNIDKIQDGAEGVYALYIAGELSYVGKSNAQRGLKQRLKRHRRKLSNRKNIAVDDVQFKAAQIYSFSAFNVESLLLLLTRERAADIAQEKYQNDMAAWEAEQLAIDSAQPNKPAGRVLTDEQRETRNAYDTHYAKWKQRRREHRGQKPKAPKLKDVKPPFLNNSGFGSNDTGAERDTQKTSLFDRTYPLDLDCVVDADSMSEERVPDETRRRRLPKNDTLLSALDWFGENVSFTFRVSDESKESLRNITVNTNELFASAPMRTVLARISERCPDDWTVTVMKGKVLAYEGQKKLKDVELHLRRGMEVEPNEGEAAPED